MSAEKIFHDQLKAILAVHTERGVWFAWYPVKTPLRWVWLRKVSYVRFFSQKECGFVTQYSTELPLTSPSETPRSE